MDIESKRYRVRSIGNGQVEIESKQSGRRHYCPIARLPSLNALSQMHETAFDRIMQKEMS